MSINIKAIIREELADIMEMDVFMFKPAGYSHQPPPIIKFPQKFFSKDKWEVLARQQGATIRPCKDLKYLAMMPDGSAIGYFDSNANLGILKL